MSEPAPALSPAEQLGQLVAWGGALFYWAEAGHNPRVRTYLGAAHYVSTSLSVGYANLFPVTELGKLVGALVMAVGPALSARALDAQAPRGGGEDMAAVTARLDAILAELRRLGAAGQG